MSASEPYVAIFDSTLRDGEQSPGVSITLEEKLEIARALRDLHVDAIEAGFPAASLGVFEGVRAIARTIEGPMVCALARCVREDIDRAFEAVREATRKRLHVFIATSPIHREHKLRMSREQILATLSEGVAYARSRWDDVEFSAEDACRTEPDFIAEVVERAIEAGAKTINLPDTVGYSVPNEITQIFRHLRSSVRGIDGVTLSVQCHDDLGLAVANSFAAVEAGARQVECTINGLGERAGNCSLEEIVMAMITRRDYLGVNVGIQTRLLCPTSRLVSRITGLTVPPNKAVVGFERLRARGGDSPARGLGQSRDLRGDAARGRGVRHVAARSRKAQRPSRAPKAPRTAGLQRARRALGRRARDGQTGGRAQEGNRRRRFRASSSKDARRCTGVPEPWMCASTTRRCGTDRSAKG